MQDLFKKLNIQIRDTNIVISGENFALNYTPANVIFKNDKKCPYDWFGGFDQNLFPKDSIEESTLLAHLVKIAEVCLSIPSIKIDKIKHKTITTKKQKKKQ